MFQGPNSVWTSSKEALEVSDLTDLGYVGDAFTWRNNSHTNSLYIRERLDRAVANEEWRIRFPLHKVINGEPRHSDHRPVIVETEHRERVLGPPRTKTFRFEASWTEEDCAAIVENA